jgi:hypothetical protein
MFEETHIHRRPALTSTKEIDPMLTERKRFEGTRAEITATTAAILFEVWVRRGALLDIGVDLNNIDDFGDAIGALHGKVLDADLDAATAAARAYLAYVGRLGPRPTPDAEREEVQAAADAVEAARSPANDLTMALVHCRELGMTRADAQGYLDQVFGELPLELEAFAEAVKTDDADAAAELTMDELEGKLLEALAVCHDGGMEEGNAHGLVDISYAEDERQERRERREQREQEGQSRGSSAAINSAREVPGVKSNSRNRALTREQAELQGFPCKRRSNNPSLKRPGIPVAPE